MRELVVRHVRRPQGPTIDELHDDVSPPLEDLRPLIQRTTVGFHRALRRACFRGERDVRASKVEPRGIVEHVGGVGDEHTALHTLRREHRATLNQHLLGAVGDARPGDDGRLLRLRARGGGQRDHESRDDKGRATHQTTLARKRSCKWTTPTNASVSSTTGITMIPFCSSRYATALASSPTRAILGLRVMTVFTAVERKSPPRSTSRLRSPAVNTPATR